MLNSAHMFIPQWSLSSCIPQVAYIPILVSQWYHFLLIAIRLNATGFDKTRLPHASNSLIPISFNITSHHAIDLEFQQLYHMFIIPRLPDTANSQVWRFITLTTSLPSISNFQLLFMSNPVTNYNFELAYGTVTHYLALLLFAGKILFTKKRMVKACNTRFGIYTKTWKKTMNYKKYWYNYNKNYQIIS